MCRERYDSIFNSLKVCIADNFSTQAVAFKLRLLCTLKRLRLYISEISTVCSMYQCCFFLCKEASLSRRSVRWASGTDGLIPPVKPFEMPKFVLSQIYLSNVSWARKFIAGKKLQHIELSKCLSTAVNVQTQVNRHTHTHPHKHTHTHSRWSYSACPQIDIAKLFGLILLAGIWQAPRWG